MGRPAGSPNKNKKGLLAQIQREFPDYHPVIEMVKIANDMDNDLPMRFNANKEVAQYVTPKLRAIEHKGETDHNLTFGWQK